MAPPARALSAFGAARRGLCPVCGVGPMMRGMLTPETACPNCGADFARHQAGDGAVFIVMTTLCVLAMGGVLALELTIRPPLWAHLALMGGLSLALTLLLLPFVKRYLIAQSVLLNAGQRLEGDELGAAVGREPTDRP